MPERCYPVFCFGVRWPSGQAEVCKTSYAGSIPARTSKASLTSLVFIMPIKIPTNLPGRKTLEQERVPIIAADRAALQDIRPLQMAILNLMPDKVGTETQLLRVIGSTPLQVEITLLHAGTHASKNTSVDHLTAFYQTINDVRDRHFDAMIVTGAPVEQMPFEDVTYWKELQDIFEWAKTHVYSTFFICWGAQAALYHYHAIPKYPLPAKHSGVYPHRIYKPFEPLIYGFDDDFRVPVSRNTEVRHDDVVKIKDLDILAESEQTGICLVHEQKARRVYMFNHLEYDADTLKKEYDRDHKAGINPQVPFGYFPQDNPANTPAITWRAHRNLLFQNWINMVYQGTPYNLKDLPGWRQGWEWG